MSSKRPTKEREAGTSSSVSEWLFDSEAEEETQPRKPADSDQSILTRRVPGGVTRRTTQLHGALVAELRIFNAEEVSGLTGFDRCEKAIIWLRYQDDAESPEFKLLKDYVSLAKTKFKNEGIFYKQAKRK